MTSTVERVNAVLRELEKKGSRKVRDEMLTRYGITAPKAYGVPVGVIKAMGKKLGTDHELALALWDTGWYEARLLTSFIDDPARVTAAQMDRWARDFDNWGVCDTLCFNLFDRTPHAWRKVEQWGPEWPETLNTVTFTEADGMTTITTTVTYPSKDARDAALKTGMRDGMEPSYARLDQLLETLR